MKIPAADFRKDERQRANRSRLSCKHRKSKRGNVYTSAEKFMRKSLSLPVGWETV